MSGCRQEQADPSFCTSPSATRRVGGRADRRSVCSGPATRERPSERLFVAHIAGEILPSNTAELAEAGAEFHTQPPRGLHSRDGASSVENTHRMIALVQPSPLRCKGRCRRSYKKDRELRSAAWCPLGCP
jgi:hypothetical protein